MLSQDNVIGKIPTPRAYEEPGGQPPDGNPVLPLPPSLERSPSPTPLEGENGSKRVRSNADGIGQFDTVAMETEFNSTATRDVGDISLLQEMDAAAVTKQSDTTYASKVQSNGMNKSKDKNTNDFFDQEIKILDEDVIVNTSGSIPSIQFSNRVHDQDFCKVHKGDIRDNHQVSERDVPSEKETCSESNLYGPWMMVQSRRRNSFSSGRRNPAMEGGKMQAQGSRFGVLNTDPVVAGDTTAPSIGIGVVAGAENNGKAPVTTSVTTFSDSLVNQRVMERQPDGKGSGTQSAAYLASNPDKKKKGSKKGTHSVEIIPTVVTSDPKVIQHVPKVQSGSHAAIRIVESLHDGSKVRHVGSKDPSSSGGSVSVRKGLRFKKPGLGGKGGSGVVDWVKSTHARIDAIGRNVSIREKDTSIPLASSHLSIHSSDDEEILEEDQWARMSADMEEFDGGTSQ
ncbi:hypothetical protein V6N11_060798 [Hibiscus sabdariffa]|uniref:Uncharacterized protein n=1 Tax=Hibiscus sabdariffa TaxID=183260 RepID=A0ABR2QRP6_9ROSI